MIFVIHVPQILHYFKLITLSGVILGYILSPDRKKRGTKEEHKRIGGII